MYGAIVSLYSYYLWAVTAAQENRVVFLDTVVKGGFPISILSPWSFRVAEGRPGVEMEDKCTIITQGRSSYLNFRFTQRTWGLYYIVEISDFAVKFVQKIWSSLKFNDVHSVRFEVC